jgi:cell division septal protein FtsQ
MATRTRENRRAERQARETGRTPAIYRGANVPVDSTDRAPVAQVNVRRGIPWRIFSGLIVVSLIIVLIIFFSADAFYVRSIAVSGQEYLANSEVFAIAGVEGQHVFWVDPLQVRENLLNSPTIADANVGVNWAFPLVSIAVEERQPALVWDQAGVSVWVDVQGRVMRQRTDRNDLLHITTETLMDGAPTATVDQEAVIGALQLDTLLPELQSLRYHPDFGLGFNDTRGWEVWFGVGGDMPEKLAIYMGLVSDITTRGIIPRAVYVIDPDRPYIATLQ